ncbi:MAG: dihydroorotase [Alphaproteobacteria bacterium]|nr:dihydroorotase [Alphaproteobacteria bacterium]MBF0251204.1 dihydroorotase [Alphaproteobacteria bacterium]
MSVKLASPLGRVAYVNARLLDPATGLDAIGGLLSDGEAIVAFGPGLFKDGVPEDAKIVDCAGLCLAPGLVDMRIQISGKDFENVGASAVAGGVTAAVCLPSTTPVIDDRAVVEFVARAARKAGLVKIYPYGAVTKGLEGKELAEMGLLAMSGAVAFTDGDKAVENANTLAQAFSYASTFGLMIVEHPEEPALADAGCMNDGETATRLGLTGIPKEAEIIMVERDLRLAAMTGGRLHFSHVSTAESLDLIRAAKDRGVSVTCDTAPPYFALNETAVGDYRTFAKLSPPLRSEADREAVVAGLKDGAIDAIASDHAPRSEDMKRLPFADAQAGGVGMETLLPITLELVHNGHLGLLEALGLITCQPAELLGLEAGRLKPGAPADLILFDPDRGWQVTENKLVSKAKNTPFDGRPVQGRVMRTVIDGRTVFEMGDA